jgi:hypothetical protein
VIGVRGIERGNQQLVFKRRLRRLGREARKRAISAPPETRLNLPCSLSERAISYEVQRRRLALHLNCAILAT